MKMIEYLFSYGTLQESEVQSELFGRSLNGEKDILPGYKASVIEIKDESFVSNVEQNRYLIATISDDINDAVEGTAFEVTEEELFITDKYEPCEYKRIKVELGSGKPAWVYVAA